MSSIFSGISSSGLMTGLGQAANAFSGYMDQSNAGEAAARAAEYNAQIAQNNAAIAMQTADANRKQQERANMAQHGKLTTQILKQGVEMQGTPILLLGEDAAQGSLAAQNITYQGQLQANQFMNQAAQYRFQADQSRSAAQTRATGTLLTGLNKAFNYFGG